MYKIGDRVIYAYANPIYGTGKSNPLVGTVDFCEGAIVSFRPHWSEFDVDVHWDNGKTNVYKYSDLELVNTRIIWEV